MIDTGASPFCGEFLAKFWLPIILEVISSAKQDRRTDQTSDEEKTEILWSFEAIIERDKVVASP